MITAFIIKIGYDLAVLSLGIFPTATGIYGETVLHSFAVAVGYAYQLNHLIPVTALLGYLGSVIVLELTIFLAKGAMFVRKGGHKEIH